MEIKDINKLIDKVTEKGITDFEMEHDGFKIRITKKEPDVVRREVVNAPQPQHIVQTTASSEPAPAQPSAGEESPPIDDNHHMIQSPMVGTFYAAPSPGAKPYVSVGDRVKKGQVLCIVEAMKIMNEIQSDVDGVVARIHVKNEQPVEFDEPLFSIDES